MQKLCPAHFQFNFLAARARDRFPARRAAAANVFLPCNPAAFVYCSRMDRRSSARKDGPAPRRAGSDAMASRNAHARALVTWTAQRMKTSLSDVKGPSRLRSLSRVRALAGYLGREVADVPIARVAREVNRDPSTLWRDVEWLEGEMKRERDVRADVGRISAACAAWLKNGSPRR
jgi:hypothetical protein